MSQSSSKVKRNLLVSQSLSSLDAEEGNPSGVLTLPKKILSGEKMKQMLEKSHAKYSTGQYTDALEICDIIYDNEAYRTENLLLMGAIHFQLRNFSESIFYTQQCIKVDPNLAEAYSNLGNSLKELGDIKAAVQFYLKVLIVFVISESV